MVDSFYLSTVCAATYGTLFAFIAIQSRHTTNVILAGCCAITSGWAAFGILWPESVMTGPLGFFDVVRMLCWYAYLLHLYNRSSVAPRWQIGAFIALAIFAVFAGILVVATGSRVNNYALFSIPIAIRLTISVCELLLIENLYFNLPEHARWHVALPCILLGGIASLDILISADAALFHRSSVPLARARMVVMTLFAPVLVLAAFRAQRWNEPVRLSRTAVFHSATLVLSGSVLIALAVAGELLRRLDDELGWIAELSLVFSGLLCLLLFLSSRSARSVVQHIVARHFFADRYDYRMQWLQCIASLSGTESNERTNLQVRAIRTVADIVNSPNGSLFMLDAALGTLSWAGSWNMPVSTGFSVNQSIIEHAVSDGGVVDLLSLGPTEPGKGVFDDLGPVWLAVPLVHRAGVIGVVIVGPPRVPFQLDQEVFDLLRIIGREVATYIAEQRATEAILETRDLHDYSKKFAFVAHDIKNVSSQLGLLLKNAELHLENPDFQQDMLETVRASVQKINYLLKRLDHRSAADGVRTLDPAVRIDAILQSYKRTKDVEIRLQSDDPSVKIVISPDTFDEIMTHLINNAIEAISKQPVLVKIQRDAERVFIDIVDSGKGMSADFVRDHLFTPFRTDKEGGSGIGAYQARELLREVGGQLLVMSERGIGTTMRVVLAGPDGPAPTAINQTLPSSIGDLCG